MTGEEAGAADRLFMAEAIALARAALGTTAPNPAVGCVITVGDAVIGRGATQAGGRPHAEVVALAMAGTAARGGTAYVTLEPCAHHGRTPPCADALIAAGIARVVVAHARDPDPRVQGRGIARLRAAGVKVETGVMAEAAAAILSGFIKTVTRGLPWVTLKLGVTLDGCIATAGGESRWITGPAARAVVQRMRAEHDAILVGIGTVLADDPGLRCGLPGLEDRPRWRVVADSLLRTPLDSQIVRQAGTRSLILLAGPDAPADSARLLRAAGVTILSCDPGPSGRIDLAAALHRLCGIGLTSVLSEGGGAMAGTLLGAGLVDRLAWHRAPLLLGDAGLPAVRGLGIERLADAIRLRLSSRQEYGEDVLETYDILSSPLSTHGSARDLEAGIAPAAPSGISA